MKNKKVMKKKKAIFLDRDGVINEILFHQEMGIIETPFTESQFKFKKRVGEAVRAINRSGYLAILISNQPGVAMRHFSMKTHLAIEKKMKALLAKSGAHLDAAYYCLHHPTKGHGALRKICNCRKPKPGMLLQAAKDWNIDLKNSFFIGDSILDVQAGLAAGCKTVLLAHLKCDLCHEMTKRGVKPHQMASNLFLAVQKLIPKK